MPKNKPNKNPLRILLIRFSSIGDIILTTPIIKALKEKHPDVILDFLTLPEYSVLLSDNPFIDNLFLLNGRSFKHVVNKALALRKIKYDYIFDLHRSTRSLISRLLLNSENIYKLDKNYIKRLLLIYFKIRLYKKPYSVVNRYFDTVKVLNAAVQGKTEVWLTQDKITKALSIIKGMSGVDYLYSGESDKVEKIDQNTINRKGKLTCKIISLMPFAKWKTKEWGDYRFIELGQRLRDESGALIQILGGREDSKRAEKIARGIGKNAVSFAGRLTLAETTVALSLSDCLVTNDTGVMHLGSAVSIPVIAIFGSTTEELGFFPYNSKGEVVQLDLSCRPCTAKGLPACPKKHFRCMKDISIDKVYSAVKKYL
ncbi:MAG: glycosyltransferase family 9 protein [Spirochaetes bacterium]|nr:glycosyltransferase family 9 protein [Spirochaetota bacterium]